VQNIVRLYIIAMLSEAEKLLKFYEKVHEKPFLLYKNDNSYLAICGIGKVNASFVLTKMIFNYSTHEIINIGYAGANGNFKIGDIYIINDARYHDFDLTIFGYEKGQVPKLPVSYSSNINKLDKLKLNSAKIFTGDYFMQLQTNENYLVDMESTALFQVAHLANIPIAAIKVVSDIIGVDEQIDDYKKNEINLKESILEIFNKIEENYK